MAYTRVSDANEINEQFMDSIFFEQRLIDSVKADIFPNTHFKFKNFRKKKFKD